MEYSKIKQKIAKPGKGSIKNTILGCSLAALLGPGSVALYNEYEKALDRIVDSAKMLPAENKVDNYWSYYTGENVIHTSGVWQRYNERVRKANLNRKPYQPTLLPDLDADGELRQDYSYRESLVDSLDDED